MTQIALPLPADVDLSGMEFMPLFDERLTRSRAWLRAKNWRGDGPGLGFCIVNLWVRVFRETPAGSIEDDDDMLADAAACDIAHWRAMRDAALSGWRLIDGRWHHPVLSTICFELWVKRLDARHEGATRSWKMACKRKTDAGLEPPDPPGDKRDWIEAAYPGTHAYLAQHGLLDAVAPSRDGNNVPVSSTCDGNNVSSAGNTRPKGRLGKDDSPPDPPRRTPDATGSERNGRQKPRTEGQKWFRAEQNRLMAEFGPKLGAMMLMHLQKPGVSGNFGLVASFKGGWYDAERTTIVVPSLQRSRAILAEHGQWLRDVCPTIVVRHATVDELRDFKKRAAA